MMAQHLIDKVHTQVVQFTQNKLVNMMLHSAKGWLTNRSYKSSTYLPIRSAWRMSDLITDVCWSKCFSVSRVSLQGGHWSRLGAITTARLLASILFSLHLIKDMNMRKIGITNHYWPPKISVYIVCMSMQSVFSMLSITTDNKLKYHIKIREYSFNIFTDPRRIKER